MRARFAVAAAFLLALTLAPQALATPAHLRDEGRDVTGLNHACGVATDNQGDLYLASAGTSEVKVYDPSHTFLTQIPDANEPCALAVQTDGTLYVSEKATGKVVRFEPTAYPFLGTPTYGSPVVIDASGEAAGISVDPFDNRLYVAEGDHVSAYDAKGNLGVNETQEVRCFFCTGGTYKLKFAGEETEPIPYLGPASEVETKLLALNAFDPGDVSVVNEAGNDKVHLVTFEGKYGHQDVEAFGCNPSIEGGGSQECQITETVKAWNGHIGDGQLTQATGVAPYTYKITGEKATYHLAVADAAEDQVKLFSAKNFKEQKLRRTLDGPEEGVEFGFGPQGAYLASDPGSCPPSGQACAAGHFLLYDQANEQIEEFEAEGELVSETPFAFPDAAPTALAVERSAKAGNGTLYATSGSGAAAKALAFSPLPAPSRPGPEASLSLTLKAACGVAVDEYGDRYVAAGAEVLVYGPTGTTPLAKVSSGATCNIAVDSQGDLYALVGGKVVYFKPSGPPPVQGTTTYGESAVTVAEKSEFEGSEQINSLAIDPANDRLFVNNPAQTNEYKSAAEGSGVLVSKFGAAVVSGTREAAASCARSGEVFIAAAGSVYRLNEAGTEVLAQISGLGSPKGTISPHARAIAVDQSDCHLFAFEPSYEAAYDFESSGSFLAASGSFPVLVTSFSAAIDDGAHSPNRGTAYVAFDDPTPETYDLSAFGPLAYGEAPLVATGIAGELGGGEATLRGSVDPRGFEVEQCAFQYTTEEAFQAEGFASAEEAPCEPEASELGKGTGAVPVQARIGGLDPEGRYRFRVLASNKYGTGTSDAHRFGAPLATTEPAHPLLYSEATLRGTLDTSGLPTTYRFQYGTSEAYGQSTPPEELQGGDEPLAVQAQLEGLAAGTTYHFRLVAENEAGAAFGSDLSFETFAHPGGGRCPNAALRTGPSAALPDCRAYELVTPPETNGYKPFWGGSDPENGNFATALAAADGEGLLFETEGPLPGTEGNGVRNGYRATRGASGWEISLYGPTYPQMGFPLVGGVSTEQRYSFWTAGGHTGSLDPAEGIKNARYIALPEGGADPACGPEPGGRFELIGCGSEGADPEAIGRWISPGAGHVIFTSGAQLEPKAPAEGTLAIYDRSPGGETHVVSLLPGEVTPGGPATYLGVSADGSAVAFGLGGSLEEPTLFYNGGALYLRHDAETLEVTTGPVKFAGLSRDGAYLFFIKEGGLYRYDAEAEEATEIAPSGDFVNVAADGTRAYFSSTEDLAEGAQAGKDNLYLWEAEGDLTRFVAALAPEDLEGTYNLGQWARGLDFHANGTGSGPAIDPSRSTVDGGVLLFQSHAPLTGYDSNGHWEVFRYDAGTEGLACLSCGLPGTSAGSDALLQDEGIGSPTLSGLAPIANLSADGKTAFFSSQEQLLPGDANHVNDVYEWREGRLSLISSGQSDSASFLYAASASGDDVFLYTLEKLVGADVPGSASLYDARVNGGFSEAASEEPCQGDACQGAGTPAPPPIAPASAELGPEGMPAGKLAARCAKGKRKVVRKDSSRCVAKHHRSHVRHERNKGKKHHHRGKK